MRARKWVWWAMAAVLCGLALVAGVAARSEPVDRALQIRAPEIVGGVKWINSKPLTLVELRGKVVLIDFWEYTCLNCIRTFPYLKQWHEKYADKGLVIIGVHTPEFAFAGETENVEQAVKRFGMKHPVVLDTNYIIWHSYANRYWPAKFMVDKDGYVRYFHFGEGAYGATETQIQALLREANPEVELPDIGDVLREEDKPGAVCYPTTRETYAGYQRGGPAGTFGNPNGYQPGRAVGYRDPGNHEDGRIYLEGRWRAEREAVISARDRDEPRDYLALKYHAIGVNAVLRPEDDAPSPIRVWLEQDGKPLRREDAGEDVQFDDEGRSYMDVAAPRMYHIIQNEKFGQHELRLATGAAGLGIYAFTFVSCAIPKDVPGLAIPALPQ